MVSLNEHRVLYGGVEAGGGGGTTTLVTGPLALGRTMETVCFGTIPLASGGGGGGARNWMVMYKVCLGDKDANMMLGR